VLAERAQDAQAQTTDPPAVPAVPSVPPPDLPPVTAPPPPPALPPAPEPALPPAPSPPPAIPLPAPPAPTVPGIDPGGVTGTVGPLPDVPEVSAPEATLPELPEVPVPAVPLETVLDLRAAPAPATPAPMNAPDRAPSVPVPDPAPSRVVMLETGGLLAGIDFGFPPARGPPADAPGSPHPCPGGGSTHPTRPDQAALLPPGADDASRRAGLHAEARTYASALLRDPLLRPD